MQFGPYIPVGPYRFRISLFLLPPALTHEDVTFKSLIRKMWPFWSNKNHPVPTLEESKPQESQPVLIDVCEICTEIIDAVRHDGSIEVAYKLPCGHTFGNLCILKWLSVSNQRDCPNCRRLLTHPECGHLIMPHESTTAPPSIAAHETPAKCISCRGKGGAAMEVLRLERELLEAKEAAIRGMRQHLRTFFGPQAQLSTANVDGRIADLRKGFAEAQGRTWRIFEGTESRESW
jgi:hypothetical protein